MNRDDRSDSRAQKIVNVFDVLDDLAQRAKTVGVQTSRGDEVKLIASTLRGLADYLDPLH